MVDLTSQIKQNLKSVHTQIETACSRAKREPAKVKLITVTKYADWKWVETLLALGYHELGESRPQQLADRAASCSQPVQWHLIGQLQRNKIRKVVPVTHLIHSVDSWKLLKAIDRIAGEENLQQEILLQVNIAEEAAKQGFSQNELRERWNEVQQLEHVAARGLMMMAPKVNDPEETRPFFKQLRELKDELNQAAGREVLTELSMGMSRDFPIAVEEGATMVRVGSGLFNGLSRET